MITTDEIIRELVFALDRRKKENETLNQMILERDQKIIELEKFIEVIS